MKRSERVIVKFKCRKQKNSIMYKRKNLGKKSQELANLKFSERLFGFQDSSPTDISPMDISLKDSCPNGQIPEWSFPQITYCYLFKSLFITGTQK